MIEKRDWEDSEHDWSLEPVYLVPNVPKKWNLDVARSFLGIDPNDTEDQIQKKYQYAMRKLGYYLRIPQIEGMKPDVVMAEAFRSGQIDKRTNPEAWERYVGLTHALALVTHPGRIPISHEDVDLMVEREMMEAGAMAALEKWEAHARRPAGTGPAGAENTTRDGKPFKFE